MFCWCTFCRSLCCWRQSRFNLCQILFQVHCPVQGQSTPLGVQIADSNFMVYNRNRLCSTLPNNAGFHTNMQDSQRVHGYSFSNKAYNWVSHSFQGFLRCCWGYCSLYYWSINHPVSSLLTCQNYLHVLNTLEFHITGFAKNCQSRNSGWTHCHLWSDSWSIHQRALYC